MSKKTQTDETATDEQAIETNDDTVDTVPGVAQNNSIEKTKRIKCIIRNQSGEDGKDAVFARLICDKGAYEAYIPRETEVEIPDYVYDFLKETEGYELVAQQVNGKTAMVNKSFKRFIIERV